MAKKFDNVEQGNEFLKNLMRDKEVKPLDKNPNTEINTEIKKQQEKVETEFKVVEKNDNASKRGRKRENDEVKVRTSISLDPNDLRNLKRLSYMERRSVSTIIGNEVKRYIQYHEEALKKFGELPEEVRSRVDELN